MISYQSTTIAEGAMARVAIGLAVLVASFYTVTNFLADLSSGIGSVVFVVALFLGALAINETFLQNCSATWEISDAGISESIFPKRKWLPFGVSQERFVPWSSVVSIDASKSISPLMRWADGFSIRLKDGSPIRIHKNTQLGEEAYAVVLEAVRARGAPVDAALTHVEQDPGEVSIKQDTPREVPMHKIFWKNPFGRLVAIGFAVFVLWVIAEDLVDLVTGEFKHSIGRYVFYALMLPAAANALWLAFGPEDKGH